MFEATKALLSKEEKKESLHELPWSSMTNTPETGLAKQAFLQNPQFGKIPTWVARYLQQLINIVKPWSAVCPSCHDGKGCCSPGAECRKQCFKREPDYDGFKRVLRNLGWWAAGRKAVSSVYSLGRKGSQ